MGVVIATKFSVTIVVGATLFALLVTGVSAAQSQGLRWGYEEGQQYYFAVKNWSINDTETQQMELMLTKGNYPSIPDPVTNDSYLPWTNFQVYFTNGSLVAGGQFSWGVGVAVPIGNWSLLSKIFENYYTNTSMSGDGTSFRIVEDSETWGYVFSHPVTGLPDTNWTYHESYSKRDGVLVSDLEYFYNLGVGSMTLSFTRLPMSPELQSILTAGVALGVVVTVIVVYARFRRH